MTDPFEDWDSFRALVDEILFRDPPGLIRQLVVENGTTRMKEMITFADGSKLAFSAQVALPPLEDMTPTEVTFLKLNGERGQRWDDGSNEAMHLARQSIAMRFFEKVSKLLDEMPERKKTTCPACFGGRACTGCSGQGCQECSGSGICSKCDGHGQVAEE